MREMSLAAQNMKPKPPMTTIKVMASTTSRTLWLTSPNMHPVSSRGVLLSMDRGGYVYALPTWNAIVPGPRRRYRTPRGPTRAMTSASSPSAAKPPHAAARAVGARLAQHRLREVDADHRALRRCGAQRQREVAGAGGEIEGETRGRAGDGGGGEAAPRVVAPAGHQRVHQVVAPRD